MNIKNQNIKLIIGDKEYLLYNKEDNLSIVDIYNKVDSKIIKIFFPLNKNINENKETKTV